MATFLKRKLGVISSIVLAGCLALSPAAQAEVNFKGKKIQIQVPFREGGGADVFARLYAPFLKMTLPGQPAIIVVNIPGGASIRGTNQFQQRAKPNGLTLLSISSSTFVSYLFGGKKVKFDMRSWRPVVVSPLGSVVYAHPKTGVKGKDIVADIKTLRGQKLLFGAKTVVAGELRAMISFELLGLDVKTVFGIERGPARNTMMRGEFTINYDSTGAYFKAVPNMIKKGSAVPLFTLGYFKDGKVVADPVLPDMPHLLDVYTKLNGKAPSGPIWEAWKSFLNIGVMASKGFVLPKGTPDSIVNTYIDALKTIEKNPKFIKLTRKMLGDYPQAYGADAMKVINNALNVSPETRSWLKGWIKKNYDYNI
ncbi:MAG: Bug family tripartite tricarboxylate transporter substrate binding protein [Rhodospirillales bacterium]|jgi:tripartite-type tricarboxylate transporter receptor subunit TctC